MLGAIKCDTTESYTCTTALVSILCPAGLLKVNGNGREGGGWRLQSRDRRGGREFPIDMGA